MESNEMVHVISLLHVVFYNIRVLCDLLKDNAWYNQ